MGRRTWNVKSTNTDLAAQRAWCESSAIEYGVFENFDGGGWNCFIFEFYSKDDAQRFAEQFNRDPTGDVFEEDENGRIVDGPQKRQASQVRTASRSPEAAATPAAPTPERLMWLETQEKLSRADEAGELECVVRWVSGNDGFGVYRWGDDRWVWCVVDGWHGPFSTMEEAAQAYDVFRVTSSTEEYASDVMLAGQIAERLNANECLASPGHVLFVNDEQYEVCEDGKVRPSEREPDEDEDDEDSVFDWTDAELVDEFNRAVLAVKGSPPSVGAFFRRVGDVVEAMKSRGVDVSCVSDGKRITLKRRVRLQNGTLVFSG